LQVLSSIKRYPLSINSTAEASILVGVEESVSMIITEFFKKQPSNVLKPFKLSDCREERISKAKTIISISDDETTHEERKRKREMKSVRELTKRMKRADGSFMDLMEKKNALLRKKEDDNELNEYSFLNKMLEREKRVLEIKEKNTTASGKREKPYCPKPFSGGYAIMISLGKLGAFSIKEAQTKKSVIEIAEKYSASPFVSSRAYGNKVSSFLSSFLYYQYDSFSFKFHFSVSLLHCMVSYEHTDQQRSDPFKGKASKIFSYGIREGIIAKAHH
jgi:hypothetical protein